MATSVYLKRGTTAQWVNQNPVLAAGEIAYDTSTRNLKFGNQGFPWFALNTAFVGTKGLPGSSLGLANRIQWLLQSTAPEGWLPANGIFISLEQYPELQDLPIPSGFAGGIGDFSVMQGGGTNYGYGLGQSFASSDISGFPQDINGVTYSKGSGALLSTSGSYWQSAYYEPGNSVWGYKFHRPVVINKFALSSHNGLTFDFGPTQFLGSNDGITYTSIWSNSGGILAQQSIATPVIVTNTTAYTYYKFNTAYNNQTYSGSVAAAKIALEGVPVPLDPQLRQLPSLAPITANASTLYPYIKL
jgi:hypothetical protein